jgi:hypothetical protein
VIAGVPIYSVSPPMPTLARPTLTALRAALTGSLARETPGLVVAPAGTIHVDSEAAALAAADEIRGIARTVNAAVVFGIDVGPPRLGSVRLFACLGGAPAMWPVVATRTCPLDLGTRTISIGGARVLVLAAPEALDPTTPRRIRTSGGVDAVLVLSHGGATVRWAGALARLELVTPIVVAAHHGGVGRGYATKTLGVRWLSMPERVEAQQRLMG